MHFGRVETVDGLNFELPHDPPRTRKFLSLGWSGRKKLYVACPIWSSKAWKGSLYPAGTKAGDYLSIYAQHFDAVELNSTFYAIPKTEQILQWTEQVPTRFRFCPKVNRGVTERLSQGGWAPTWRDFCWAAANFGQNLGMCFAQLPESFKANEYAKLYPWLQQKPQDMPLCLEFRHRSWFEGPRLIDKAIDLLFRHNVATVITEAPGRLDTRHLSLTQPKVMIRFNGHLLHRTDRERLQGWADRIASWCERGLDEVYFFVHQADESLIPKTAELLTGLLQNVNTEHAFNLENTEASGSWGQDETPPH